MTRRTRGWLRLVYLIEFVILALPALMMIGSLAIFGIAYAALSLSFRPGTFAIVFILICLSGFLAMANFCNLSMAYLLEPVEKFHDRRHELQFGLIYAAIPLIFLWVISAKAVFADPSRWQALPFLGSLALFIPITHLWLALREAGRATIKESG